MSSSTEAVGSAMDAHILSQEVAAFNVANILTPGFKRNVAFMESLKQEAQNTDAVVPEITGTGVDFSQGELQPTHNELDFAIRGDGFFTLSRPDTKDVVYTRNGRFTVNADRVLVSQEGLPVLGDQGPITLPEGENRVGVSRVGELMAGLQSVARFQIARFEEADIKLLKPIGNCQFKADDLTPVAAGEFEIHQGFVERSNVQPVTELVHMIASLRDYEACARSLRAIGESAQKLYAMAAN